MRERGGGVGEKQFQEENSYWHRTFQEPYRTGEQTIWGESRWNI